MGDAQNPIVILRMRNQSQMGATLIDVLDQYAEDIEEAGGKLYLTGLDEDQLRYLRSSGKLIEHEEAEFYQETNVIDESTELAVAHANEWIKTRKNNRIQE